MTAPLPTALPYGIRDVKVTPFTDDQTEALGTAVDLPNMQTLSFTEAEDFAELRGDDRLVTMRGQGSNVEWELEAGGLSFAAVRVMYGGVITESGVAPALKRQFRKKSRDTRPFFRIEGQAISDSGGDVHVIIYRCKATDNLEGELADGEFWTTGASGTGLPSVAISTDDVLYDFVQNQAAVPIPQP
jgi:hypothetical protein